MPSERRDRREGGEDVLALSVLGRANRLGGADIGGAGRPHLRQARQVGVAQDEADVGMGYEAAARVDDVCVAALAHPDLRDHLPDQLEVHLRDADAGLAPRAGERQRHVRLRLPPEVDRAVVGLPRSGLRELRLLREVDPAPDQVHLKARHSQLLLARRVGH